MRYRARGDLMATVFANVSIQLVDADGTAKSFDVPIKFSDAIATLASLTVWINGLIAVLDPTIDVKVNKARVCLSIPLPGGIKTAPNASSINERTALFTMVPEANAPAYGIDVPGYLPSLFSGDAVPNTGATAALLAYMETPSGTIVVTDRYGNAVQSLRKAKKTFRE